MGTAPTGGCERIARAYVSVSEVLSIGMTVVMDYTDVPYVPGKYVAGGVRGCLNPGAWNQGNKIGERCNAGDENTYRGQFCGQNPYDMYYVMLNVCGDGASNAGCISSETPYKYLLKCVKPYI
jgi:hypothetical protein